MENRRSPSTLLSKMLLHDPFDDPFFRSSPLSCFFDSPFLSPPKANQGNLTIEEVPLEGSSSSRRTPSPVIEHPDEQSQLDARDGSSQWLQMPSLADNQGSYTFSSSSFHYDGPQGAYFATTKTRRGGPQGVVEEKFEEQDSTTCTHTKRMSRGLGNKGHSFICQKDTKTGKIKENEILHNLAKDKAQDFDRKWEQEAEKYLPGWMKSTTNTREKSKSLHGGRSAKALPSGSQDE